MIRRGSLAIVKTNKAKGGPNAIKVQPKNSITVMFVYLRKGNGRIQTNNSYECYIRNLKG